MRRLLVAAACLVAFVVGVPAVSSADPAAPAAGSCASGAGRVTQLPWSVVTTCVRDGLLVVTDSAAVPVVVRTDGLVGTPTLLDPADDLSVAMLRAAVPDGQTLMPGESAAWPLGDGGGRLQVAPLTTAAVARSLAYALPPDTDELSADTATALGALVEATGAALDEQRACQQGGNVLVVTACEIPTATAIGQALVTDVPWSLGPVARNVLLDHDAWREWIRSGAAAERAVPGDQTLVLAAVPAAVPDTAAEGVPAPGSPAVTVVSTPSHGGTSAAVAGSAGTPSAGRPAAPAGSPVSPPAPALPPPATVPGRTPSAAALLQALIAKAQQAQQAAAHGGVPKPAPAPPPAPGKGQGNGRGGHGHGG